jgi:hypothetical protein
VINNHGFHDASLLGLVNDAGLTIHRVGGHAVINVRGRAYELAVGGDGRIVARQGAFTLTGSALLGAIIPFDGEAGASYELRIEGTRTMLFPFPLGSSEPLEAYVLTWRAVGSGGFTNLCANPPVDLARWSSEQSFPELLGMAPTEAIVYTGDRIDAAAKTMSAIPDPGWFNIGCAGHTVAKLHLTRNTIASQHAADPTLLHGPRQATLKLLVADYCGTGRAFTVPGQPLQWKGDAGDPRDAFFSGVPVIGIEARWTADGASCLSAPRMATSTLPLAQKLYPDVWTDIARECPPLPPCAPDDPGLLVGMARVSANAPLPAPAP